MMGHFNWDDTRIFLAVAREGTLSAAAETLEMGIATLSRRLERLEHALGITLFSRHQTGYRLTDDGEALLTRAEALECAGLALGDTAKRQGNVAGRVRLATSDNLATYVITPSFKSLFESYPDLQVEILSGVQSVSLQRRDADLAIRMVKPENGNLTLKRLGSMGFGLYAAEGAEIQSGTSMDEMRQASIHYVGWPASHQHLPTARWMTRLLRGKACRIEANTLAAQLSAVAAGLGIGLLPHFMAREKGLICLDDSTGFQEPLWLVMHADLTNSRRVRVLADHLIALFESISNQLTLP